MIRYYKGIQKVKRISVVSPLKTAIYEILESGPLGSEGTKTITSVRLCHKKKKEENKYESVGYCGKYDICILREFLKCENCSSGKFKEGSS